VFKRLSEWFYTSESTLARWFRAARGALFGEMPVLAGGTAMFALIAAIPTLAAVVSIYGLIADPKEIAGHLKGLETVLPQDVVTWVGSELVRQSERGQAELGFAVAGSIVAALYTARSSASALMTALNRAYRVREQRGRLRVLGIEIAMGAASLVGVMLLFIVVVALPSIVAMVGLKGYGLVRYIRWPSLMLIVFTANFLLYRFAPSPRPLGTDQHNWPGAAIATVLLVLVSWGFSEWIDRVGNYAIVYGAFGSVIIILLWFYLSVIALVLGGFVNAELERQAGAPDPDRSMY
jgi:membrane protein